MYSKRERGRERHREREREGERERDMVYIFSIHSIIIYLSTKFKRYNPKSYIEYKGIA